MRETALGGRLRLPASLAEAGVALRSQEASDRDFLEALYVSVRWDEMLPVPWTDADKRAFLADQFRMQHRHYATYYGDAEFNIVELHAQPIGRIYLHRGPEEHRVVDVSLLPEHRGRGIGGALMQAVIDGAAAAGCSASINVEAFNPARRLYQRLGFLPEGPLDGPYQFLAWRPRPPSA
ncbi:MAG: GNAT family N-acetyltransferase [Ignavibacteria bacterium]